jgi:hypothetical protein
MLPASASFLKLMHSNIRPKIEPTITVKGQDSNGNQVILTWKPSNIQNMTYKRGIDPVGRTLPYMELTWTEIYYGKLNAENYPEKYNNVVKYMAVELSFEQSLGFFNTWKDLYSAGYTWKSVLEQFKTWKGVKRGVTKETVKLPTMFLVAKPTIQGQTITWTARDLFYFLNQSHAKSFAENINYRNPIRWFLLDERGNFRNSNEIFEAITQTQSRAISDVDGNLDKIIVFDGSTKNLLMNYASIRNYYWDFENNYAVLKSFADLNVKTIADFEFSTNIIKEYPQLTENLDMSAYSFKQYFAEVDEESSYTLSPAETITYKGANFYKFLFKGLGVPNSSSGFSISSVAKDTIDTVDSITVTPVNFNSYESSITIDNIGEVFVEDNPLNPYSSSDSFIVDRANVLANWFGSKKYSMALNSLSNVALETGDLVTAPTNLFNGDTRVVKNAIVVGIELQYNGALKQLTLLHEVNANG